MPLTDVRFLAVLHTVSNYEKVIVQGDKISYVLYVYAVSCAVMFD